MKYTSFLQDPEKKKKKGLKVEMLGLLEENAYEKTFKSS